jgi:hypothetical protein
MSPELGGTLGKGLAELTGSQQDIKILMSSGMETIQKPIEDIPFLLAQDMYEMNTDRPADSQGTTGNRGYRPDDSVADLHGKSMEGKHPE